MAIADAVCKRRDDEIGTMNALTHPKFKEADAIRILCQALDEKIQRFLVFASLRGDTLWVYLSHPGMIAEFERTKPDTLERMRVIYREEDLAKVLVFHRVKAHFRAVLPDGTPEPEAPDRASGNFEIQAKDEGLWKKFASIREHIRSRQREQKG